MNAKKPKGNGSDAPSSQSVRSTAYRSRLGRTLFTAGVFALLAMLFVPLPANHGGGYRLIFSGKDTSIAFFQLLLNVGFAALLGAILAIIVPKIVRGARKLPRWIWQGITGIVMIALLIVGALAWRTFMEAAVARAHSDEQYAHELLAHKHFAAAKSRLLNAALNWRLALRFDEGSRVRQEESRVRQEESDFASRYGMYAMKLREQALLKVEPQVLAPMSPSPATQRFPWKTNIVTTVFWIGGPKETDGSIRTASAWDPNWTGGYGGVDDPDSSARRSYIPVAFIPRQNPFYCALPYNDVTHGQFKPEAPLVIPWFKQSYTGPGQSVCWHRWLAIRKGNRTCYAQWEDSGPFLIDHFQYVFGNERPRPNASHGAGLSVSPAVRDYLGLAPTDVTDWQFVEVRDVPPGPWRSYGENNHFVIARRQIEQRMEEKSQGSDAKP